MRFYVISLITIIFLLTACKDKQMIEENAKLKEQVKDLKTTIKLYQNAGKNMRFLASKIKGIKARIITNMGNIEIEFFPEKAPLHCFNFITRAECGYYDNTKFHRVIKGFMIQGGDPTTKTNNVDLYGTGAPIVAIPHEFNDIKHKPGILSMARPGDETMGAGSQFFIMHADYPSLDGKYTAFGEVVNGMDVVDAIANLKTIEPGRRDRPEKSVIIRTIEVYR
jgi:peptidyl-prolyl cis-trans isomerase B (cyclophilin B)